MLLASLRKRLLVLPLDKSVSAQERDNAIAICNKGAETDWDGTAADIVQTYLRNDSRAPRSIRFRSEQLLADCDNICETMGITDADRNFAVIPLSHSYGFSNLITPLLARGVPMVLSSRSDAARDPGRSGADRSNRFPRHAGFLPGVL